MKATQAVARKPSAPMNDEYTFDLTLEIGEGANVTSADLQERVLDAIQAYDDRGRVFGGRRMPDGDSWLLGLSIGLKETKRIRETRGAWFEFDKEAFGREHPFWEESRPESDAVIDISVAIDERVEELKELQANLWDALRGMEDSTERRHFVGARRKLRALLSRIQNMLDRPLRLDAARPSEDATPES